ncbi:hypothetical protein MAHJHV63_55110 [Mycobacterium avium subsp. hominissuis]
MARVRIPHELRIPAPDRLEHAATASCSSRSGAGIRSSCGMRTRAMTRPSAALDELLHQPGVAAVALATMVPSMTAVDGSGTPITPGLLYGDGRGRTPGGPGRRRRAVPG